MASKCIIPGCGREIYDEGPFCEYHGNEIEVGRTLRGDYGAPAVLQMQDALIASPQISNPREEIRRLRAQADKYAPRPKGRL